MVFFRSPDGYRQVAVRIPDALPLKLKHAAIDNGTRRALNSRASRRALA
jgi:hypothetical protein